MNLRALALALAAALALATGWLALSVYAASEARIDDLQARLNGDSVEASFRLEGAFDDDFRRRLASGLPTEIIYRFVLEQPRRRWLNKGVGSSSLQVVAMYNAITGEYLVNFKKDGNLVESRVERDEEQLRNAMMSFESVGVFTPVSAEKGRLQLRVRAELGTSTFLAFIPRTLATDWARVSDLSQ